MDPTLVHAVDNLPRGVTGLETLVCPDNAVVTLSFLPHTGRLLAVPTIHSMGGVVWCTSVDYWLYPQYIVWVVWCGAQWSTIGCTHYT